ncbi:histidine phosphatase family protein [Paenibacillus thermotolerans]|uniref:histidine phosphatase family protein n=1 Tax=Paenibacillus thermotolerans TaxID=3027807 RepID=UPI002367C4B0|nr:MULTISPECIES: histidine phosphatase family protein [unclassified Paenibacillus]
MKTTVYLTRHGETVWNREKRLQGHKDSPLTNLGRWQARWLGEALEHVEFGAVYSSSSNRAMETAGLIAGRRSIRIVPSDELREINMGSWEGRIGSELETEFKDNYFSFWNTPHVYEPVYGGESFYELERRVIPYLHSIIEQHAGDTVLIVTHAAVLKTMMSYFERRPLQKLWDPPLLHSTALCKVEIEDGVAEVKIYGDTSHYRSVREAVGAIVIQGDECMLVQKIMGAGEKVEATWDFPKGGVEPTDADHQDALARELSEETGSTAYQILQRFEDPICFPFSEHVRRKIGFESQKTTMFLVRYSGDRTDLKPKDEEIGNIKFVKLAQVLSSITYEESADFFQRNQIFIGEAY